MEYLMTGLEVHPDKGFGITADAYYKSAEHLHNNHFENYNVTMQAEMPQNYLYRHSIELYLKSLIIIFHKELKIDYGNVLHTSEEPEILSNGKWIKLYNCHYIDKLYEYWLKHLLLPNIKVLTGRAPLGDWNEYTKISELMPIICKYDQDSSYFRYPITKNGSLDHEKYKMQKFKGTSLNDLITELKDKTKSASSSFTTLFFDEDDNIVEAFKMAENILIDVRDALKEVAYYFNCIHVMTRVTLCKGK